MENMKPVVSPMMMHPNVYPNVQPNVYPNVPPMVQPIAQPNIPMTLPAQIYHHENKHLHVHAKPLAVAPRYSDTAVILVLFILLVIISRSRFC